MGCRNSKISSSNTVVLGFIISGAFTVRAAKHQNNKYLLLCALSLNILCIIVTIIAASLTVVELAHFRSVSYRNYGQAKLGREVSRVLLFSYPLEFGISLTYSICSCSHLGRGQEDSLESVTEVVESTF
ncbi:membrane-spanning 4-domains subfamily A member 13 isoform X4 [Microtus ochrogaster]|uniref:Membrane-spanning 4-domains subfamily A member 13 isoform X4 n=1 Tax=Microtus ochrogaster TaxID=79684 RepID=A0ABM1TTS1_MICOH|nr:membrane-spanning 4-domains subfamily A member 13 isoform X4 [Microtus ochrogaster]